MPELAFSYFIGMIIVFICVNWNLLALKQRFKNQKISQLNKNLEKIDKFWSISQGRLVNLQSQIKEQDQKNAIFSFFIFGTMLIFLSWFGFIIFWIYWFSLNKLAVSQEERKLFQSRLTTENFDSKNEIENVISLLGLPE